MNDKFSYNEATAASASDDLGSVIRGLESSLTDLGGYVSSAKSNWDGDEMDVYAGIQGKWDEAAATVQEILTSVQTALTGTTDAVVSMRSSVRSALEKK